MASRSKNHLVLVLVLLSYKQLDIYLEKDFEIKDKPVIFRCLEKGGDLSHLMMELLFVDLQKSTKSPGPVLPTSDLSTIHSWIVLFLQPLMTTDGFPSK